ncbi:hypothetical protein RIF29_24731 [Crotalaria pallida]|uniref:Uncharacterized protein n=1 Tax=Crotalaria pallida TaxID=3830 RepID=A0AAN9HWV7_CROPI
MALEIVRGWEQAEHGWSQQQNIVKQLGMRGEICCGSTHALPLPWLYVVALLLMIPCHDGARDDWILASKIALKLKMTDCIGETGIVLDGYVWNTKSRAALAQQFRAEEIRTRVAD